MKSAAAGVRRFLCVLAVVFAASPLLAGVQSRLSRDDFAPLSRPLAVGAKTRLMKLPVGDNVFNLELERFEVWAPDAEIIVVGEGGKSERIAPPAVQYYKGMVEGDPDSMVFVSVGALQGVQGMVIAADRRYEIASRKDGSGDVMIQEADDVDLDDQTGFTCDLERMPIVAPKGVPSVRAEAGGPVSQGTLSGTATYTLNMALDSDFELYTDLGSNSTNVTTFLGNVTAAMSIIYERDVRTNLVITFTRIHTTAADPFTINPGSSGTWNSVPGVTYTTSHALAEFGDVWHNSPPFAGARSATVLVSGKTQTAGVAWSGTACDPDFLCGSCGSALFTGHWGGQYTYIGLGTTPSVLPDPNGTVNTIQYGITGNYWPILGLAHELGHLVNSPHTHCVALTAPEKANWSVTRNFVDECENFDSTFNPACFSGTESMPAERGTIMSYCHNFPGNAVNPESRFLFGQATEPSQKIVDIISAYMQLMTPNSPTISAPPSMTVSTSSSATITGPVGGQTYDWSITNGTINSGNPGTSINFTANANPVTLRVKTTSTNGCAATDFVNVTVITCGPPTISVQPQPVFLTSGSAHNLTVTATGDGPFSYQWYVGAAGNTTTPTGTNSSTLNVSPVVNTSYWVRVTGSCGSTDSVAATVTVVPPSSTATSFYTVSPCRIIDTRNPAGPFGGPAPGAGVVRAVQVGGVCGIPSNANSVSINITSVGPGANGWFTLYPGSAPLPGSSTINYRAGKNRANNAVVPLSISGILNVYNSGPSSVHFIIDVNGYFQ